MAFFEVARLLLLVIVGFQNSFRHSSVRANDYQEPPKPDSKGRTISPTGYLEGDRLRHTSVGNSTTRLGRESLPSTITRACGHNKAVKHIVEERLSKFSVVSRKTQLALNSRKVAAGQKRREMTQLGDLLFMDDVFPFETSTVVWQEEAPPEAPAPLRFHAEFRLEQLEISQPNKAAFLRKELVPAMIASLRHYVNVRRPLPPEQPLFLPRHCKTPWGEAHGSRCKSVQPIGTCLAADHEPDFFGPYTLCSSPDTSTCRRYPGGAGVSNADFVLYVSASPSLCGKGTAAFAGACELDPATFRPVAGEINFCPDFILTSVKDWGYMLDTSVRASCGRRGAVPRGQVFATAADLMTPLVVDA